VQCCRRVLNSGRIERTLSGREESGYSGVHDGIEESVSRGHRWVPGTHQGAVSLEHLDYYLVEFTFRFNRRRSRRRGRLFFPLVQQAVAVEPATLRINRANQRDQTTTCRGYLSQVDPPITQFSSVRNPLQLT
jgi:hypothetical protein